MTLIIAVAHSTTAPLAAQAFPPDLPGCYALYDSVGAPASKSFYFVPPFVRLEPISRRWNVSNDSQFHSAWNLVRLDSSFRPIPQTFIPVPYVTQWSVNSRADTVHMVMTNGFSGTRFAFAIGRNSNKTLRGIAVALSDIAGIGERELPVAASATRVPCRETSPLKENFLWAGPPIDHIIVGIDSLERGMELFRQITGINPVYGGAHPGRGTRNALVSLGGKQYLEIIAPNPADTSAEANERKKIFAGFHRLTVYGWAAHTDNMDSTVAQLEKSGFTSLKVVPGSRRRPDGKTLRWRTMSPWTIESSVLPFFIEWRSDSPHPSSDAPGGCSLRRLLIITPSPDSVGKLLIRAGLDATVGPSRTDALRVTLRCSGQDLPLY